MAGADELGQVFVNLLVNAQAIREVHRVESEVHVVVRAAGGQAVVEMPGLRFERARRSARASRIGPRQIMVLMPARFVKAGLRSPGPSAR